MMNYPTISSAEFSAMASCGYRYALLTPDHDDRFIPVKTPSRLGPIARECGIPAHYVDITLHPHTGKQYELAELPKLGAIIIDHVGEENLHFRIVNGRGKHVHWRGWTKYFG
jgi:hypothetical protein